MAEQAVEIGEGVDSESASSSEGVDSESASSSMPPLCDAEPPSLREAALLHYNEYHREQAMRFHRGPLSSRDLAPVHILYSMCSARSDIIFQSVESDSSPIEFCLGPLSPMVDKSSKLEAKPEAKPMIPSIVPLRGEYRPARISFREWPVDEVLPLRRVTHTPNNSHLDRWLSF